MKRPPPSHAALALLVMILLCCASARAAEVQHFNVKSEWEAAVGAYDTIDFTGFPYGTLLTDQYADQGVLFSGWPYVDQNTGYLNDGWGMWGLDGAWLHFDEPIQWFAAEHPGFVKYDFFRDGTLIATSQLMGSGGTGKFSGVLLDEPFDTIYLYKPFPFDPNWVFIDDIHFGPPIPAPGALALLGLAALGARRRRTA